MFIYVFSSEDYFKVGVSENPKKRLWVFNKDCRCFGHDVRLELENISERMSKSKALLIERSLLESLSRVYDKSELSNVSGRTETFQTVNNYRYRELIPHHIAIHEKIRDFDCSLRLALQKSKKISRCSVYKAFLRDHPSPHFRKVSEGLGDCIRVILPNIFENTSFAYSKKQVVGILKHSVGGQAKGPKVFKILRWLQTKDPDQEVGGIFYCDTLYMKKIREVLEKDLGSYTVLSPPLSLVLVQSLIRSNNFYCISFLNEHFNKLIHEDQRELVKDLLSDATKREYEGYNYG